MKKRLYYSGDLASEYLDQYQQLLRNLRPNDGSDLDEIEYYGFLSEIWSDINYLLNGRTY